MDKSLENILTATDAAKLLGVSVTVFRNLVARGYIRRTVIDGKIRYLESEVLQWSLVKKPSQ